MEPQEGTEAKEGKLEYVCTSLAILGRQIWWTFSHCLSCLLIRLAAVVLMPMCLPHGQRNEGGSGGRRGVSASSGLGKILTQAEGLAAHQRPQVAD